MWPLRVGQLLIKTDRALITSLLLLFTSCLYFVVIWVCRAHTEQTYQHKYPIGHCIYTINNYWYCKKASIINFFKWKYRLNTKGPVLLTTLHRVHSPDTHFPSWHLQFVLSSLSDVIHLYCHWENRVSAHTVNSEICIQNIFTYSTSCKQVTDTIYHSKQSQLFKPRNTACMAHFTNWSTNDQVPSRIFQVLKNKQIHVPLAQEMMMGGAFWMRQEKIVCLTPVSFSWHAWL